MKHRPEKSRQTASPALEAPTSSVASRRIGLRRFVFRIIAISTPFVLLVVVEFALRVAGYGYPTSFFLRVDNNGQTCLVENPKFGWRFFPRSLARSPQPISISAKKEAGCFRIFVLGESAAMGDPEPAYGVSRMLERMLRARHPGKSFEVVNTGMTAINSHVIREIARDLGSAEGDCLILYAGNNEVVGPFGAGTVFGRQAPSPFVVRLSVAFKRSRLGQALAAALGKRTAPGEWEGMEMFLNQRVTKQDARLAQVYRNFRSNLEAIIATGQRSGARVIATRVPVNLKDCPPFGSTHRESLSAEARTEWDRLFALGKAAETRQQYAEALQAYDRAFKLDGTFAELVFRRAACRTAVGDLKGASEDYVLAVDLDTLRFRADSKLNELIQGIAVSKQIPFVVMAGQTTTNQLTLNMPGDELFYDHVHLNFHGTHRLASLLVAEVERALFENAVLQPSPVPDEENMAGLLAFTEYDRKRILEEMRARLHQPPFNEQSNAKIRDATLERSIAQIGVQSEDCRAQYLSALAKAPRDWVLHARFAQFLQERKDAKAAAEQWVEVTKLLPREPEAYFQLGNLAQNAGQFDEAERLFLAAKARDADAVQALNALGLLASSRNHADQAREYFEEALRLNPHSSRAHLNLGVLMAAAGKTAEAREHYVTVLRLDRSNVAARINLAKLLVQEGKLEQAISLYLEALEIQPQNPVAHYNLGNALSKARRSAEALEHYQAAVKANPGLPEAHYALGLELTRAGRIGEALDRFAQVVRLSPEHVEAHFNYGVALAREKRYEEAVREFQETLRLQPGHSSARAMLDRALSLLGKTTGG